MDSRLSKGAARRARLAICTTFLFSLAACGSEGEGEAKSFPVILISMDGVQASDATPNLSQLAKASTVFENVTPSDASHLALTSTLLTGLLPNEHGAGIGEGHNTVLDPSQTPLPGGLGLQAHLRGRRLRPERPWVARPASKHARTVPEPRNAPEGSTCKQTARTKPDT